MNKNNYYISIGYLVYILLFAFFSLSFWKQLNQEIKPEIVTKFVSYYLFLGIPNFLFLGRNVFFRKATYKTSITDIVFLGFILWNIISLTYSINSAYAWNGIFFRINLFLVFLNLKWIFQELPSKVNNVIAHVLVILGCIFIGDYFYSNVDKLAELLVDGSRYQGVVRKLKSLLGTKNVTAMFLSLVFMLHYSFSRKVQNFKFGHYSFQFLAFLMLLIIGSRNAYIALTVFVITIILLRRKKLDSKLLKSAMFYGSIIVLFLIIINTDSFVKHFNTQTLFSRAKIWTKSSSLMVEKPIIGYGTYQYLVFKPYLNLGNHGHPHNDYIRVIIEHGLIGYLIWMCLILLPIINGIKKLINSKAEIDYHLVGLIATMLAYLSLIIFDGLQFKISHQLVFILVLAKLDVLTCKNYLNKYTVNTILCLSVFFSFLNLTYCYEFIDDRRIHLQALDLIKRKENTGAIKELQSINQTYYFDRARVPVKTQLTILARKEKQVELREKSIKIAIQQYPFNYNTLMEMYLFAVKQKKEADALKYLTTLCLTDHKKTNKYICNIGSKRSESYFNSLEKILDEKTYNLIIR